MSTCAFITYGINLGVWPSDKDVEDLESKISPYGCTFELYGSEYFPHYILAITVIIFDAPLSKGGQRPIIPAMLSTSPKSDYALKRACQAIGVEYERPNWILAVWEEK
jgi:hypothetical protein